MSGGVDSSVVAGMLHARGETVVGLTMQLWNQRRLPELAGDRSPPAAAAPSKTSTTRATSRSTWASLITWSISSSASRTRWSSRSSTSIWPGRTPIPCTLCNNFIKFDQFLEMAAGVGASRIATGHYARIGFDDGTGRWQLRRSVDNTKDQTYFLFGLTQEQLSHTVFPLGGMQKSQVRELARQLGIPTADKPDSQEICFVPNGDYAAFIEAYFKEQGLAQEELAGELVTADGKVVGEHAGVHRFTVGQRRGLRVAAGEPLYVISTEPATQACHYRPQ